MRAAMLTVMLASMISGGCSLLNRPDRGLLDGGADAGPDANPPDAYVPDADIDANADAYSCRVETEACDDQKDNDCDLLIDCADPDCVASGASECCVTAGPPIVDDEFDDLGGWQHAGAVPGIVSMGAATAVQDFGEGAVVGIVAQPGGSSACLQPELGANLRFRVSSVPCGTSSCSGSVQVVLGPSSEFRTGGTLVDDLGIRATNVGGRLQIEVTRGGTAVGPARTDLPAGIITVSVDLALGVASGVAGIVAHVSIDGTTAFDNLLVLPRTSVRTDRCPGFFLGIQGTGDHVRIEQMTATQLDCSNPARVDPSDGIPQLTARTFSAANWAGGGIGSPAILARASSPRLLVWFDGSMVDRGSTGLARLPLAIGGANFTAPGGGNLTAACTDWTPRAGTATGCATPTQSGAPLVTALSSSPPRIMQDPALVADGTSIRVVWAGERTGGDHNLRLFTDTLSVAPPGGLEQLELEVLEETCPSIRSPAIVPLVGSDPAEWLVFYVCTNAGSSEVHAARGPLTALTRTSIVLGAAELGTVAANGVRDIAAVAFNYAVTPATTPPTRRPTYRLWLLTHGTESTVSFVEGTAVMGGLPTFVPYAGNPIFTATEPDLGPCLGRCELHGIAATRVPGVPTRVQLMVERWDPGSATAPFALIPLRQSWPSDVP